MKIEIVVQRSCAAVVYCIYRMAPRIDVFFLHVITPVLLFREAGCKTIIITHRFSNPQGMHGIIFLEDVMAFCNRLREARVNAGYNLAQLSSEVGVASSTLSNYEAGIREPSLAVLAKLINTLGIDANYLFQDDITSGLPICDRELLDKYHSLGDDSRSFVDLVLSRELNR